MCYCFSPSRQVPSRRSRVLAIKAGSPSRLCGLIEKVFALHSVVSDSSLCSESCERQLEGIKVLLVSHAEISTRHEPSSSCSGHRRRCKGLEHLLRRGVLVWIRARTFLPGSCDDVALLVIFIPRWFTPQRVPSRCMPSRRVPSRCVLLKRVPSRRVRDLVIKAASLAEGWSVMALPDIGLRIRRISGIIRLWRCSMLYSALLLTRRSKWRH